MNSVCADSHTSLHTSRWGCTRVTFLGENPCLQCTEVPSWMFLGWLGQLTALLDKPESPAVQDLLLRLARDYPHVSAAWLIDQLFVWWHVIYYLLYHHRSLFSYSYLKFLVPWQREYSGYLRVTRCPISDVCHMTLSSGLVCNVSVILYMCF